MRKELTLCVEGVPVKVDLLRRRQQSEAEPPVECEIKEVPMSPSTSWSWQGAHPLAIPLYRGPLAPCALPLVPCVLPPYPVHYP